MYLYLHLSNLYEKVPNFKWNKKGTDIQKQIKD